MWVFVWTVWNRMPKWIKKTDIKKRDCLPVRKVACFISQLSFLFTHSRHACIMFLFVLSLSSSQTLFPFRAVQEIRQLRLKQDGFIREISDLQETVEWKDKKIAVWPMSPSISLFYYHIQLILTWIQCLLCMQLNANFHFFLPLVHISFDFLSHSATSGPRSGLRATERIHRCDPNWARWAQRRGGDAQRYSEGTQSVCEVLF